MVGQGSPQAQRAQCATQKVRRGVVPPVGACAHSQRGCRSFGNRPGRRGAGADCVQRLLPLSSDAPTPASASDDDDDGRSVSSSLGDLDGNLDKVLDVETVRPLLAALPEREQSVLWLRFFENMTQTQIGERLGISQMHVSRLLARSLATLREQVQTQPA